MENNENNFQNEVNQTENNVNTVQENKKEMKSGKGKTIALMVIVLLLVLAVGVLAGVMFSDGNKSGLAKKIEENITNNDDGKSSKKIDESKPWVYDAEYGKDKENKKIMVDSQTGTFLNSEKDLVVPFININSEYAKKVNEEIKDLYERNYSKYGTLRSESSQEYKEYNHYELRYVYYLNDNILSVIITFIEGSAVEDGELSAVYTDITYNFNIDTLEEATLNEMAVKCGFTSGDAVTSKINEWEKKQKDILAKANHSSIFIGVQKNKYFIDGNGKLNFIYRTSTSTAIDQKQEVEPNKEIELFWEDRDTGIAENSISIKEEFFSLELPSSWKGKYKYKIYNDGNLTSYIFSTASYDEELFIITRTTKEEWEINGTKLLKKTNSYYYYFSKPSDSPAVNPQDGEYSKLFKDVDSIGNTVKIIENNSYSKEYINIIDKIKNEYPNSDITADLIYFNNDNIPDLVIGISGYWVSLYIYENGKVYNPVANWSYGTGGSKYYEYQEKNGNIYNYGNDFAGAIMYETNYVLNSKYEFDILSHTSKGADIESTDPDYEEIQKELEKYGGCYYNGKKISEQEYNDKLGKFSISTERNNYKILDGKKSIEEVKKLLQ